MPERIPAEADVRVVVAASQTAALASIDRPFVAVIPERSSKIQGWNDFGRNFVASLSVAGKEGAPVRLPLRLMIEGALRSTPELERLEKSHGAVFSIERIEKPFVSLLPESDSYRLIVETLGFDAAVVALRMLGDAVVARAEGLDDRRLRLADTVDFHLGVLRNPEAYVALRRGARHLSRGVTAKVADMATSFRLRALLPSAVGPYEIDFDFDPDPLFRDRTNVLIGRNGVGKTLLLKALVEAVTDDGPTGERLLVEPRPRPSRVLVFSSVPTDPFPRKIGAWRGIDYEYFAVNATHEDGADSLLTALAACVRDEGVHLFGPERDMTRLDVVKSALSRLGLWQRIYLPLRPSAEGEEPLKGVQETGGRRYFPLHRRSNELAELRMIQQLDWERSPVILDDGLNPRALSSGEHAMMRFAAQATAAVEQGSLLLLDEPETHLHPNFVSDLMEILSDLLASTGSVAIVATHSAYVVREVPRRRVNILGLASGHVQVDKPRMQTFGASIDKISQFVFGDTSTSHRYQRRLEEWADEIGSELGIEDVVERFGDELNSESLSFVARRLSRDG